MPSRIFLATLLALCSTLAMAQAAVYESKDKAGPVFSDAPTPGAEPVALPPLSVIPEPQTPPQPPQTQAVAPAPYSQLVIVTPANEGTIHTNTGAFDMRVQIQPSLRIRNGDAIIVRLDGNQLARGYHGTAIHIKAADWARAATAESIEHSLQVAITDRTGAVLIESAPVRFYAHRAVRR
jgi:hypothetical protein